MKGPIWRWARTHFPRTIWELEGSGVKAWLTGGCVRDFWLGQVPKDLDLLIPPGDIRLHDRLGNPRCPRPRDGHLPIPPDGFPRRINRHGNCRYWIRDEIVDLIWPECFYGQASIREAVAFNDLSINCMGVSPEGEFYDPMGAQADLAAGLIRTNPRRWKAMDDFEVCHLILRLIRYQARLGFRLADPEAVRPHVAKLASVEWPDLQRLHDGITRAQAIDAVLKLITV